MHRAKRFALLVAAGVACSGQANEEGDISASGTGSIVTSLASRTAADADILSHCGDGVASVDGDATLQRLPFLQQIGSSSALLVFRSTQASPVDVDVTTFDGAPVATATAEPDATDPQGAQWVAHLQGLKPATGYCYSLRGLTTPAGFRTAPEAGAGAPVRFAAWGDSGYGGSDQKQLLEQIMSVPFDFAIHAGDLAYDHGSESDLERTVFQPYARLLKNFAFFPVAGNHDYETSNAAPFLRAFVLPENGDAERWYSFDWGDVHFVALDTEQTGARQAEWLNADLAQNRLPWTVVFGHRPPYSSGEHGSDDAFRKHFVPVLEKHRVPLVLNGHEHDYERTRVLNGVTYVVTGGGGRGTRPVGRSGFTAFSDAVIHFVYVEIAGRTLALHAIDGTGREFDQTVIERLSE